MTDHTDGDKDPEHMLQLPPFVQNSPRLAAIAKSIADTNIDSDLIPPLPPR